MTDYGRSKSPSQEQIQHRVADLADAQVPATLALAAAIGLSADLAPADMQAWREAVATPVDRGPIGRLGPG
jgi:hypothetical protein